MQNKIRNKIETNDRKWLVVTVSMEPGESWALNSTGATAQDTPDATDTSHHIGCYISGEYDIDYPVHDDVHVVAPCGAAGEDITGKKNRYPSGSFTVHCTHAGDILFILPRGAEPSLGYELLTPGEISTVEKAGWAVDCVTFEVTEVASGPIAAPANAPLLVFWEN